MAAFSARCSHDSTSVRLRGRSDFVSSAAMICASYCAWAMTKRTPQASSSDFCLRSPRARRASSRDSHTAPPIAMIEPAACTQAAASATTARRNLWGKEVVLRVGRTRRSNASWLRGSSSAQHCALRVNLLHEACVVCTSLANAFDAKHDLGTMCVSRYRAGAAPSKMAGADRQRRLRTAAGVGHRCRFPDINGGMRHRCRSTR